MTEKSHTDTHATSISAETERAVRDFVRSVVSHLREAMKDQTLEWEVDTHWERGASVAPRYWSASAGFLAKFLNQSM